VKDIISIGFLMASQKSDLVPYGGIAKCSTQLADAPAFSTPALLFGREPGFFRDNER